MYSKSTGNNRSFTITSDSFGKRAVLELIITPQLKHFDFPRLILHRSPSDDFIFYLLNLASLRCPVKDL